MRRRPSKKRAVLACAGGPATTRSGTVRATQRRGNGVSQVSVGPRTTRKRLDLKRVLGIRSRPKTSAFFASW
jgi:hypothetical protein